MQQDRAERSRSDATQREFTELECVVARTQHQVDLRLLLEHLLDHPLQGAAADIAGANEAQRLERDLVGPGALCGSVCIAGRPSLRGLHF